MIEGINLKHSAQEAIAYLEQKLHCTSNPEAWQAIAAQFLQEKGSEWWANPTDNFNVGNVTKGGSENGFVEYPSLYAGVIGYCETLLNTSFDEGKTLVYQNVLDAIEHGTPEEILEALHSSPWCDPPYPLKTLENVMKEIVQLTGNVADITEAVQTQIDSHNTQISELNAQIAALQAELDALEAKKASLAKQPPEETVVVSNTKNPGEAVPNNSLWNIALNHYGSGQRFVDLLRLNPGINPSLIREGQEIRIK